MAEKITGILEDERRRRGRAAPQKYSSSWKTSGRPRAWSGTLSQRLRVAKRLPQAVVKITSHNSGRRRVGDRLHYISKKGEITLETDQGLYLENAEEIDQYVAEWATDFSTRRNSRDALSLVVSLPPGTDPEASLNSARDFFQEVFAENHEFAFAGHDDQAHYHVHVVVKMRGHDGKQLATDKKDLRHWREVFVERAREHGIELDASPRYARGKGRRATRGEILIMRERAEKSQDSEKPVDPPRVDVEAAKEAVRKARENDRRPSPFEKKMRATFKRERMEYAKQAAAAALAAKDLKEPEQRLRALEMASDLAVFAKDMPRPRSRTEALLEELGVTPLKRRDAAQREVEQTIAAAASTLRAQLKSVGTTGGRERMAAIEARLAQLPAAAKNRGRSRDRGRDRGRDEQDIER